MGTITPGPFKKDLTDLVNYKGQLTPFTPVISPTGGGNARQFALFNHPKDADHVIKCLSVHDELVAIITEFMEEFPDYPSMKEDIRKSGLMDRLKATP